MPLTEDAIKGEPQIQISSVYQLTEEIDVKDEPIPQSSTTNELTADESLSSHHRKAVGSSILDEFYKKLENQEDCDIEFTTTEDRKIKAHRIVLQAGSTVFKEMFDNSNQVDPIRLADLKYDVAEEILHFIYTGKVKNLEQKSVEDLLKAAINYKINKLKIACEKFLRKNLSIENALVTLTLSKKYELDELKKYAKAFIDSLISQCDSN